MEVALILDEMERLLGREPRVLNPVPVRYPVAGAQPTDGTRRLAIVDCEGTGLDTENDELIDIGVLAVDVAGDGSVAAACRPVHGFRDPGIPIPEAVVRLTGIDDTMVRGTALPMRELQLALQHCEFVVAHNAAFDFKFFARVWPESTCIPWLCSLSDIDWAGHGVSSAKLDYLAMLHGFTFRAHRAIADVYALAAVLASALPDGSRTGFRELLDAASSPGYAVKATGAPFAAKDTLKRRGYRWDAEAKVWHTRVRGAASLDEERDWLTSAVYGGVFRGAVVPLDPLNRFG